MWKYSSFSFVVLKKALIYDFVWSSFNFYSISWSVPNKRISQGLLVLKMFGCKFMYYNIFNITGISRLTLLLLLKDRIKIYFKFNLYIGMGVPCPIVIFPSQEPIFLKLLCFLSFILFPYNLNHSSRIL